MQYAGLATGIFECRLQIDPRLGPAAVAARAIFFNKRPDLLLEDLLSIRTQRRLVRLFGIGWPTSSQTEHDQIEQSALHTTGQESAKITVGASLFHAEKLRAKTCGTCLRAAGWLERGWSRAFSWRPTSSVCRGIGRQPHRGIRTRPAVRRSRSRRGSCLCPR